MRLSCEARLAGACREDLAAFDDEGWVNLAASAGVGWNLKTSREKTKAATLAMMPTESDMAAVFGDEVFDGLAS